MTESDFFAQMALELHAEPTAERTIDRIAEYARSAIDCDEAGVMLVRARDQVETAAATSPRVAESHNLQILFDEGPCLDAIAAAAPFHSGDIAHDESYPAWGPAVAELGLNSALSLPMATHDRRYGSLNLYSERHNAFNEDDIAVAHIFMRHAVVALATAHDHEGLQIAVDARKLIGQAQGILMERFDIDAERAFDFLRRQSQHRNIKLRVVAESIIEHRGEPSMTVPQRTAEPLAEGMSNEP